MRPFRMAGRRTCVAGHRGMVGSAIVHQVTRKDCELLDVTLLHKLAWLYKIGVEESLEFTYARSRGHYDAGARLDAL